MEPYFYENAMMEFKTKVKKRNQDHPSQISRVGPSNFKEISCKGKNTKQSLKVLPSAVMFNL